MAYFLGDWRAFLWALHSGMASAVMLVSVLYGFIPPAWGNEIARQSGVIASESWDLREAMPPPLPKPGLAKLDPALILAEGLPVVAPPEADPQRWTEDGKEGFAEGLDAAAITFDAPPSSGDISRDDSSVAPEVITATLSEAPTLDPETLLPPAPVERSEVFFQAAYLQQGNDISARLRGGGIYVLSPSVFAGVTADLSTGPAFSEGDPTGLSLNELYLTASPANLPELRFTVGLMDLTSYLDRNSFAKDSLVQFFNPVFQTNPALSTVNVASRPGALVNWMPVDQLYLTATAFSANRNLGELALNSFAGEVGVRVGNVIVRGTYVTSEDAGQADGFGAVNGAEQGSGLFGPMPGDRETGFGLNGEAFIPAIKLGLFGRYGWYTNQTQGSSGQTYSLGVNGLDVFLPGDRLGLGYGLQLSNAAVRQANNNTTPDVWELFYDAEIIDNLRAGVSVQQRNAFTETYLGFRVRYDLRWNPLRRATE